VINDCLYIALSAIHQGFCAVHDPFTIKIKKGDKELSDEHPRTTGILDERWQADKCVFIITFRRPWIIIAFTSLKLLRLLLSPSLCSRWRQARARQIFHYHLPIVISITALLILIIVAAAYLRLLLRR
jgi:hypothetical protein